MRGINKLRTSSRAFAARIAALGLLLGGGVTGVALAQGRSQDEPPYRSSIQVPEDKNEAKGEDESKESSRAEAAEGNENKAGKDAGEADSPAERAETARLQKLARVTADQARSAALAKVPGQATGAELENEDGNLVYGVKVKTPAGEREVIVDAGTGKVLHVEQDQEND